MNNGPLNLMLADFPPPEQPVSFERPPVNEVALAVQFVGDAIDLEVLGAVAGRLKEQFPSRQQHPPLAPMVEDFSITPTGPQVIFKTQPDLPRTWFISADGSRLVQVQADRLAYNWRRLAPEQEYPRYETVRGEFIELALAVEEEIANAGRAELGKFNVVELTYINELDIEGVEPRGTHPPLDKFIRFLKEEPGQFLPAAEDARFQLRWRIPSTDNSEQPAGRLYAAAEPMYRRNDDVPVYVLTMTARLVLDAGDPHAAIEQMDLGHTWIVEGFKDITTNEMQQRWGIQEAQ